MDSYFASYTNLRFLQSLGLNALTGIDGFLLSFGGLSKWQKLYSLNALTGIDGFLPNKSGAAGDVIKVLMP